jgi:hypothetical protein
MQIYRLYSQRAPWELCLWLQLSLLRTVVNAHCVCTAAMMAFLPASTIVVADALGSELDLVVRAFGADGNL